MALLHTMNITKTYDHLKALDHVSLSLEKGNILCLLGPSGCGKTTLLRIIAGLEKPGIGKVFFNGEDMEHIEPHRRGFGMMFQEYALFPHKDVFGNVSFGLRMQRLDPSEVIRRSDEVLELVGLSGYDHRNVGELSGGERQRVALARSLAPQPRLLLLDEPLGALDRALRERLMIELKTILKSIGMTTIFVTHDQAEAYAIADVIAVIIEGRIVQIDRPERLYRQPANMTVARFLGLNNFLEGTAGRNGEVLTEIGRLHPANLSHKAGDHVTLLIQPDAARLLDPSDIPDHRMIISSGSVKNFLFRGKNYTLEVILQSGTLFVFDIPGEEIPLSINQKVRLSIDPGGITEL
jgi:ABC-type Fe3+/spermidine/putrescine transport system ATPase subunit